MQQSIHSIKEKCAAASPASGAGPESEWDAAPSSRGPNPQLLLRQRQQVGLGFRAHPAAAAAAAATAPAGLLREDEKRCGALPDHQKRLLLYRHLITGRDCCYGRLVTEQDWCYGRLITKHDCCYIGV
eukprot:1154449-Pelagomonas_calceolata.AAC.3